MVKPTGLSLYEHLGLHVPTFIMVRMQSIGYISVSPDRNAGNKSMHWSLVLLYCCL